MCTTLSQGGCIGIIVVTVCVRVSVCAYVIGVSNVIPNTRPAQFGILDLDNKSGANLVYA